MALAILVFAVGVPTAEATVTTMSTCGSCGFQTWSAADLNNNGVPFFDGPSADGGNRNIGHYLTGTGGSFTPAELTDSPMQAVNYYGTPIASTGGAADNYWFHVEPIAGFNGKLVLEIAGLADLNRFGWYKKGDSSASSRTVLLNGAAGPGATVSFTPTADFGFFLESGEGNLFFTESSLNSVQSWQHFALFSNDSQKFWMAVEDKQLLGERSAVNGGYRYGDFNDLVVRFEEVPEPATFGTAALTLLALGLMRRRMRKSGAHTDA